MFIYCINNRGLEKYLTINKKYENIEDFVEIDEDFNWYRIINDKNISGTYDKSRFVTVDKWREIQLNKLLK
jgi:hypothetical protein